MNSQLQSVYRQLQKQVISKYTSVNGNKLWENTLTELFRDAEGDQQKINLCKKNATDTLTFIENRSKYSELIKKYSRKLERGEQIKRTANYVGLELPKSSNH
ncbi:hypothetical protein BB559_003173 [Furculomyces boomerangus]|uniref:Uncharacterized protein n=2 Tax=Harpellales TaxID=61421 RepID=A0A2T9YN65_9FUNG|nr:hypothetical protein BB559_003173 [Furculomyces boomerangus]PVZ99869.1 hypothetical protein BB558_004116 [Smittium angustum]